MSATNSEIIGCQTCGTVVVVMKYAGVTCCHSVSIIESKNMDEQSEI